MKRKSIILLSSILAGSLLVGGAFAAYAVTDNADPFGINVTPGNLDEDDTQYVTLEWGATTNLEGVGLLKVGENRKVGVVSLVSTPTHEGKFSLSIRDLTEEASTVSATRDDYLLDYLNIKVYAGSLSLKGDGSLPDGTPVEEIAKSASEEKEGLGGTKSLEFNATGTTTGAEYTIFLTLDESALPFYTQMANDKVRLEVDWGKKDGDQTADGKIVYFTKPSGWAGVYAYAWKGEKVNAAWPGVEMVSSYNEGLYQISIPSDMVNLVFNDGTNNDEKKTADLTFTGYNANTAPYWNGSAWADKPAKEAVADITATVAGNPVALVDKKAPESENRHEYELDLTKGNTVVFKEGNTTIHFYHWDNIESKTIDDGASYTAGVTGKYTFFLNQNNEMYVDAPVVYFLVGDHNDWTSNDDSQLTHDTGYTSETRYVSEAINLAEGTAIKVTDGNTKWFNDASTFENCHYTISNDDDKNVVVDATGWYIIHFYPVSANGNHVILNSTSNPNT